MTPRTLLPLVLLLAACASAVVVPDTPYEQPVAFRYTFKGEAPVGQWPELAVGNVRTALPLGRASALLLTNDSVWLMQGLGDSKYERVDTALGVSVGAETRLLRGGGDGQEFVLLDTHALHVCASVHTACTTHAFDTPLSHITCAAWASKEEHAFVGTPHGLFWWNAHDGLQHEAALGQEPVSAVLASSRALVVGTETKYWRRTDAHGWRFEWVTGNVDATVTSFAQTDDDDIVWIGTLPALNMQYPNMTLGRIGGMQGLPFNTTSCMDAAGTQVWMGTSKGIVRYDRHSSSGRVWSYYYGPRWHPGQAVLDLHVWYEDGLPTAWAVTDAGLAVIDVQRWTLAQKAAHFETIVPRHVRYGMVSDVSLPRFGDTSTVTKHPADSDALWTGQYVLSQAFRWAVTRDADAKRNAWMSFEGMERMATKLTGIKGYPARTFAKTGEIAPGTGNWYNSTTDEGWIWKGETSSDQITGHMATYPVFAHLVAETPEEKQRATSIVTDVMHHIVANNFYLIGEFGEPTKWGRWNWVDINDNMYYFDERGPNSVQILAFLESAYALSGNDSTFSDASALLREKHGYALNVVNCKIQIPNDDNYSDDELTLLPFFVYLWSGSRTAWPEMMLGLEREWRISSEVASPLWNLIYSMSGAKNFELDRGIETLRQWPLELIDWPVHNSHRLDIIWRPDPDRGGKPNVRKLLPYDEICMFRWNGDPFQVDCGSGHAEYEPNGWLVSYWLGRYLGVIGE